MRVAFSGGLLVFTCGILWTQAFVGRPAVFHRSDLHYFSSLPGGDDSTPIESMRVKEIQEELRERQVSFSDCFDKENLVKRLREARANTNLDGDDVEIIPEVLEKGDYTGLDDERNSLDRNAKLAQLRSMSVPELREECAKRRIRWAEFVDKEEMIQALATAMTEKQIEYSVSGLVHPGMVADLTEDQLEIELSVASEAPLLLNIYTQSCKPCRKMAPELEEAAFRLGTQVRVVTLNSEKYPVIAKRLGVAGLPTNILMNGSEELQRIEGALMKDQILQFVEPFRVNSR